MELLAIAAAILLSAVGYVRWRRARRARRFEILVGLAQDVGMVIGGDSELVDVDSEAMRVRRGDQILRLPTPRLVAIALQYEGAQRRWHLQQLIAEAEAVGSGADR